MTSMLRSHNPDTNTEGEVRMKEPSVQVPVSVLLDLIRVYAQEPQELVNRNSYLVAISLERKAYRKYQEYRKQLKEK